MRKHSSHVFALPHTFLSGIPREIILELQDFGLTGVNLALNYHGSRDFLLRQGPRLEYLKDGFHYYKPNLDCYPEISLKPTPSDHLLDNGMLDSVISSGKELNFKINAWAVFLHNSALGVRNPESTVVNVYGNHFLSELCPANPEVRGYVVGLTADLASRGISSLAIESLHFHGARHGEHHERFFLEMSTTTEFLLSLCFCEACMDRFNESGGDALLLKRKIIDALRPFIDDEDPWLGLELTKDFLENILGSDILNYLKVREETVSSLYQAVKETAHSAKVTIRFIDQAPLIDISSLEPLNLSWMLGIDNSKIRRYVDIYEPLVYRKSAHEVESMASHYLKIVGGEIIPILRPTFPDNLSQETLMEKVRHLREIGIENIDFYLLDTMRPRDLIWIRNALS